MNMSQGGMCVRAARVLRVGAVLEFVVDIAQPVERVVQVKARVCWTAAGDPRVAGLVFLASSNGWFGPEE